MKTSGKYLVITAASFIFSIGLSLFIDPNNLAPGGMSGLAIILNRVIPLDTGTLYLVLNIPVLILGTWQFGWKFMFSTLYATLTISGFTNLLQRFGPLTNDVLLAALAGSVLTAIGMGLVLRMGSTTGGMDVVVKCLRVRFPHIRTGTLFLIIDASIVLLSGFIFRETDLMLYSGMAVFTTSIVVDMVLYGTDEAKMIYIISDHSEKITGRLLVDLDIGVTYLEGWGAYQKNKKKVILCVMKKHLAPKAETIVREEDPYAFMIVTKATEIYGEGYKSYFREIF